MLEIRKAQWDDLGRIEEIFSCARKFMKKNGNPDQWKDDRPSMDKVEEDIRNGDFYVVESDGRVFGGFAFPIGIEPTYLDIDGQWIDDAPYGTIHRIASDGTVKGMFDAVLEFVERFHVDIRIDTHKDNRIMLHLLEKNGFHKCGIIIVDDGTKRFAFQKKNI